MLEYAIIRKNRPISPQEGEILTQNYIKRSLMEVDLPVYSHPFMGGKALLLYRDNGHNTQGSPVFIKKEAFTCLAGYVLSPKLENDPDTIANQVHHRLNSPEEARGAFGEYQIAHFDGRNVRVFCSKLMTHPVYYRQEGSEVTISNRASLTNIGREEPVKLDVMAQLQIIAHDHIFENRTAFEGVYCLDRGCHLVLPQEGPLQKIKEESLWGDPAFERADMMSLYRGFEKNLRAYIEKLSLLPRQTHMDTGMPFGISGGKDSRLLMAIFAETGILKLFDGSFTYGEEDNPEVIAAKPIAKYFGMAHEARPRSIPTNTYLNRLGHHVFQMEGEVNSRTLHGTYMNKRKVDFTGHQFATRENFTGEHLIKTEEDLKKYLGTGFPLDPIGFLRPRDLKTMGADLLGQFDRAKQWHITADNFLAYFNAAGQGTRWGGKLTAASSVSGPYMSLLCAEDMMTFTINMGPENRRKELFHLFTLGYLAPKLLTLPFAYQRWNPQAQEVFSQKFPMTEDVIKGEAKKSYNWWDMVYQDDEGKNLVRLIEGLRHPALENYVDYNHVYRYIGQIKASKGRELLSIFGLITANALFQAGDVTLLGRDRLTDTIEQIKKEMEQKTKPLPKVKTTLKDYITRPAFAKQKIKQMLGR